MSATLWLWLVGACVAAALIYGFLIEPRRLRLEQIHVELKGLPPELDGLRLVHLSDLHVSARRFRQAIAHRALALANTLQPDVVVMSGDLVRRHDCAAGPLSILTQLRPQHGVWTVLGNHDYNWTWLTMVTGGPRHARTTEQWRELLAGLGVAALENQSRELRINGASLWLVGCGDPYCQRDDLPQALAPVPDGAPCLLLCHSPDIADDEAFHRVGLALCGHTHGGQIRLPLLGLIWAPCRDFRTRAVGLTQVRGTWLYASRGVAAGNVFRFRCPPEVTLVTLRSRAPRD